MVARESRPTQVASLICTVAVVICGSDAMMVIEKAVHNDANERR